MIRLVIPSEEYLDSYKEAYEEYQKHHVTTYHFANPDEVDILEKYENYRKGVNLKPGYVGADNYWLVEDETHYFIGEITVRHFLTESLRRYGGHIGYGVRYEEWNKGYGTLMLKLGLEKAKERGIQEVLITCDDDNLASAKVMENNGLVLEDKIENEIDGEKIITRRYWFKGQK